MRRRRVLGLDPQFVMAGAGIASLALAAGWFLMSLLGSGDSAGTGLATTDESADQQRGEPGGPLVVAPGQDTLNLGGFEAAGEPASDESAVAGLTGSQPEDGATRVSPSPGFRLQFAQPLSEASVASATFRLFPKGAGTEPGTVDTASVSIDLTGQNLTFAPSSPLQQDTEYRLVVEGLRAVDGSAISEVSIRFTTGAEQSDSSAFERRAVGNVVGPTSLQLGPDGNLYVTTVAGHLLRFDMDNDGLPTGSVDTIMSNESYQFIGLAFEPGRPSMVWVSQWAKNPADEFGSEIVAYDLTTGTQAKKVVGLPRHPRGDHSVQSLRFHNGRLYASVGSVTTAGDRSFDTWGEPILNEVPVSASIIEIDFRALTEPAVVRDTAITRDSSPVRLFATGVRNAYDMVWHSNGNLYANINQNGGSGEANGTAPTSGLCAGLPSDVDTHTIADTLNLVRRDGYYGHPNPSRGECIVMGGGLGRYAVVGYPPDLEPELGFDESLIASYRLGGGAVGVSVNGIDEYVGPGPLSGTLLSADFAGSRSIIAVALQSGVVDRLAVVGDPVRLSDGDGVPIVFTHPLDVAAGPRGLVYVADFGQWGGGGFGDGGSVSVLVPISRR